MSHAFDQQSAFALALESLSLRSKWNVLHRRLRAPAMPADAFRRLYASTLPAFWLDSSLAQPGLARFSFMGAADSKSAYTLRHNLTTGTTRIDGQGERRVEQDLFESIRAAVAADVRGATALPFDFCGGLVGYFGYELKAHLGVTNRHTSALPDTAWLFVDRFLAFDHELGDWYLVGATPEGESTEELTAWFERTSAMLAIEPPQRGSAPASSAAGGSAPFTLESDRDSYLEQIAQARHAIYEGDSYEICLTNRLRARAAVDSLELYMALREVNPAPYAAYLNFGDFAVLCSSPERFLKLDAQGLVESKPIKGTRKRAADPQLDAQLAAELAMSEKDRAENLMITDLVRNDLGRVCRIGSVSVPRLMQVESYETVHQLVSTIRGRLRPECDAIDLVRASFPPGSMTGAPKIHTLEIIDRLEPSPRGIYSGALGYLSLSGAADLNVVIRTIVQSGEQLEIGAGGAIIALSDPAQEFDEMLLKGEAPRRAVAFALDAAARRASWVSV